jgi:hypothetical protein
MILLRMLTIPVSYRLMISNKNRYIQPLAPPFFYITHYDIVSVALQWTYKSHCSILSKFLCMRACVKEREMMSTPMHAAQVIKNDHYVCPILNKIVPARKWLVCFHSSKTSLRSVQYFSSSYLRTAEHND